MKSILIALTIILFTNSCVSVNKDYLIVDDICNYNDSIFHVSKEEFKIDVKKYFKKTSRQTNTILDNQFKNIRFIMWEEGDILSKQTNKQTNISKWISYRKDGSIKRSSFNYRNGNSKLFKETHYDEQGSITKVIDYEKGYTICWAEAIEIVKKIAKRDIEKYEVTGFYLKHTNLNKFPNVKPEWIISLKGNEEYQRKPYKFYHIDGVTGKFLKTTSFLCLK